MDVNIVYTLSGILARVIAQALCNAYEFAYRLNLEHVDGLSDKFLTWRKLPSD